MATQNEIMQEILNNIDPEAIRIFGTQSVKDWIEDYVINLKKPISMDDLSDYVADVHSICSEASSY
jgi:hypothetical protein